MSGGFSEISSQSWISRLGQSIVGVLIGVVMFLVAFPLLFWNEGRAVRTAKILEEGASVVVSTSAATVDPANEGKLVHMTAEAATEEILTDPDFGISAKALELRRQVEMYQWKEHVKTETRKKIGGGQETVKTYTYEKVWTGDVIKSSEFHERGRDEYKNPGSKPVPDRDQKVKVVKFGAFELSPGLVSMIEDKKPLAVTTEMASRLPEVTRKKYRVEEGMYYLSQDPGSPAIGDLRIRFEVIEPGTVSIISQQKGNSFQPYHAKAGDDVNLLEAGTHSAEEMFKAAQDANRMLTWILRIVGFVVMATGVFLVFRPLTVVASVIPFLGDLLGVGVALFAGVIAFGFSLITIAIGWVFYRPLIGIPLLLVGIGGLVGLVLLARSRRKKV